ncbi:MAG: aromatic ring-hydroxylating oxygenase subunit alpha [Acidimicrobiales bacterium]
MNDDYLQRFRSRSAWERGRSGPPEGFPALPDIALGRYTDPAFLEAEMEGLFRKTWLYGVHESELDGPGAYLLRQVAGAPVLFVRGDDGEVRAFFNACRHRGAPVVQGETGIARRLTCRYHSWSYDLQGCLVAVPDERDFVGLDPAARGLPPVRAERWGGWWFVTFDDDAESLSDHLGPLRGLMADLAASPLRHLSTETVSLPCNWKVVAEAFLEVYHARTIHPTTVAPTLDTRGTVISLFDRGHQSMISPVNTGARTDRRDQLPTIERLPALLAAELNPAHGIFPNIVSPLDARGFPFLVFWPDGVDRSRLDIHWFVADWGDGPLPHQELWDARLERFDRIMDEDYANLGPIQTSLRHAAHGGTVVNYQERRIWHVHAWIDKTISRTLGPEAIPPGLAVPDLLADWVEDPLT